MQKLLILLLLFIDTMGNLIAQPTPPAMVFFCDLKVNLSPAMTVGETPHGTRRIIPIIGGTVSGPEIKGEIISGGADWQIVRPDGVAELDAHYQFKTDDNILIYIHNVGLRVATPEVAQRLAKGEPVSPNEYYFRTVMKFESPAGKYHAMNNALFICQGVRNPDHVLIRVWKVL